VKAWPQRIGCPLLANYPENTFFHSSDRYKRIKKSVAKKMYSVTIIPKKNPFSTF